MTNSNKYLEQYERVKRWYKRFEEIDQGTEDRPSDYLQDDVYAFFLNCYHLKDWIKNDSSISTTLDVEDFINNNNELKLCADICNGIKHLRLTRPRNGQDPRFGKRDYKLELSDKTTISVKYSIDTSRGPVDAFDLATKCLQAWDSFIALYINKP